MGLAAFNRVRREQARRDSSVEEADDLEDRTVKELQDIAAKEGVDLTGVRLKVEIIAALEAAREDGIDGQE